MLIKKITKLSAILVFTLGFTSISLFPWAGQGTSADPWQIANLSNLQTLANNVKLANTYAGKYFKVMNDIAGVTAPIGGQVTVTPVPAFKGTFDGNNKIITLAIDATNNPKFVGLGLFGSVENATIKNVITDDYVRGNSSSGSNYSECIGGIVGNAPISVTLENCINLATISGYDAGGIAGNVTYIEHCMNAGFVSGTSYVGGIAAGVNGAISYCLNVGVIAGTSRLGGIAGYLYDYRDYGSNPPVPNYVATISNCFNDNQMCIYAGVNGSTLGVMEYETKDIITSTLQTFGAIQNTLGTTYWTCAGNRYPVLKNSNTTAEVVNLFDVASSPVKLIRYDRSNYVSDCFRVFAPSGVNWTSDSKVTVDTYGDYHSSGTGKETLTASKGKSKRVVPITLAAQFKIGITASLASTFGVSEVTPSIVSNNAALNVQVIEAGTLTAGIYDMSGKKVMDIADQQINDNTEVEITMANLSYLSAGIYNVVVSVGNDVAMRQFVKQ